jgi:hypothetical protein
MEVQHPIQQALASFWAFLPEEKSLRIGHYGGLGEYVSGEYAVRRQVFVDYYLTIAEKTREIAPHILFARSGDSVEDIVRFTEEWGPLRPNTASDRRLRVPFGPTVSPENYFAFYVQEWRASRKDFAKAIGMVEADDIKGLRGLLPYQHQRGNPVRAGALYPYLETGTALDVLEDLWTADGRMTKAEVRRTAKRCGIFLAEKDGPKYQMVFEAVSLMDAFWHMLLLDLTSRMPTHRTCANAKCGQPFLWKKRSDQKYCGPECAGRAARLAYYHRKGAADRRHKRKGKNVSQHLR